MHTALYYAAIWTPVTIIGAAVVYAGLRADMRAMQIPPRRKKGDPNWRSHSSTTVWAWMNRDRVAPGQYELPPAITASHS